MNKIKLKLMPGLVALNDIRKESTTSLVYTLYSYTVERQPAREPSAVTLKDLFSDQS